MAGHDAQEHAGGESQSAENPGVGVVGRPIAEAPQDEIIDIPGQIQFLFHRAGGTARRGHEHRQQPESDQKDAGQGKLTEDRQVRSAPAKRPDSRRQSPVACWKNR